MSVSVHSPRMTRDQFFDWAEQQDTRYEFDGWEPVEMTGGSLGHSRIIVNLLVALRARAPGDWEVLGPDAGLATSGDAVRYPDALMSPTRARNDARVVPNVVVVFEVLSPTSGRIDRVAKLREYRAVSSIRRYVILEQSAVAALVLSRAGPDDDWTATAVGAGDALAIPEVGIEVPVDAIYEGIDGFPS